VLGLHGGRGGGSWQDGFPGSECQYTQQGRAIDEGEGGEGGSVRSSAWFRCTVPTGNGYISLQRS
jgi:hypothetical protein